MKLIALFEYVCLDNKPFSSLKPTKGVTRTGTVLQTKRLKKGVAKVAALQAEKHHESDFDKDKSTSWI
jgi:hypothetical protein